jgi:hypothetical protein
MDRYGGGSCPGSRPGVPPLPLLLKTGGKIWREDLKPGRQKLYV